MAFRNRRSGADRARSIARPDEGGLLVNEADGAFFHAVPPGVAGAMRFFVTRMQTSRLMPDLTTIAVTSALAGEGVTFAARTLGALAAHDLRRNVCVVETNWWRATRRSRRAEPGTERPGLAEIMEGGAALDDVLVETSDPQLTLLPAGNTPLALRPVLVASDEFAAVMDKVTSRFDTVVIDVPPVLLASEAITICNLADATILVAAHGATPERDVERALEELEGVNVLGIMLNQSKSSVPRLLRSLTVPI